MKLCRRHGPNFAGLGWKPNAEEMPVDAAESVMAAWLVTGMLSSAAGAGWPRSARSWRSPRTEVPATSVSAAGGRVVL